MRIARRSTVAYAGIMAVLVAGVVAVTVAEVSSGPLWQAGLAGVLSGTAVLLISLRRVLRRWRVARRSLSGDRRQWLREHVLLYQRLGDEGRRRFERDVLFALDEYSYEGVGEVEVTDTLRMGVAAGIAVILHGRPDWELPRGRTVLLYPDRFDDDYYGGDYASYDGMAHEQGPIILTAYAVENSWEVPDNGDNVVLHELAHLFDFDNVGPDGVPSLVAPESAAAWQELVRDEMKRVRMGRSILDPYAAEAPSEFFAVATEHFFEEPDLMAGRHRDLFHALCAAYNVDPRDGTTAPRLDDLPSAAEPEG
jgi:hypothetical protein